MYIHVRYETNFSVMPWLTLYRKGRYSRLYSIRTTAPTCTPVLHPQEASFPCRFEKAVEGSRAPRCCSRHTSVLWLRCSDEHREGTAPLYSWMEAAGRVHIGPRKDPKPKHCRRSLSNFVRRRSGSRQISCWRGKERFQVGRNSPPERFVRSQASELRWMGRGKDMRSLSCAWEQFVRQRVFELWWKWWVLTDASAKEQ